MRYSITEADTHLHNLVSDISFAHSEVKAKESHIYFIV